MSRFFQYHNKYGAQMFDVSDDLEADLRAELHRWGWRKSPKLAREAAEKPTQPAVVDFSLSDEELTRFSRTALESAAREQLGIELDRRKKVENLIADIRAAQE